MARIRTFIALDVDKAIRDRLSALQNALARAETDVKWVEPANLHLTLLFLGEVDDRSLNDVCRAVTAGSRAHAAFPMTIERVGCFPNPRRPRIIWAGVGQGTQEICALHDALEEPLLELGCYRREDRKYAPHLTLGRVKSERPADKLAAALAQQAGWQGGTRWSAKCSS